MRLLPGDEIPACGSRDQDREITGAVAETITTSNASEMELPESEARHFTNCARTSPEAATASTVLLALQPLAAATITVTAVILKIAPSTAAPSHLPNVL